MECSKRHRRPQQSATYRMHTPPGEARATSPVTRTMISNPQGNVSRDHTPPTDSSLRQPHVPATHRPQRPPAHLPASPLAPVNWLRAQHERAARLQRPQPPFQKPTSPHPHNKESKKTTYPRPHPDCEPSPKIPTPPAATRTPVKVPGRTHTSGRGTTGWRPLSWPFYGRHPVGRQAAAEADACDRRWRLYDRLSTTERLRQQLVRAPRGAPIVPKRATTGLPEDRGAAATTPVPSDAASQRGATETTGCRRRRGWHPPASRPWRTRTRRMTRARSR